MFCPKCGTENPDGAGLCRNCGLVLTNVTAAVTAPVAKTSALAITSMILGILSFCTFLITAPLAIIFGIISLIMIAKSNGRLKGKVFAITGIVVPIVVAIIVVFNVEGRIDMARVISTRSALKLLHNAVVRFKLDTGRYPTEEEGIRALIEQPKDVTGWNTGGYIETTEIPKDAWGHDFVYQSNPESGKPFVIISHGADGKEGGEGYNADLRSTDEE